jgi:very-short-patch-repair endonuclease
MGPRWIALAPVANAQAGVVSRAQALAAGYTDAALLAHVRAGRWQRVHPGVVATFTGQLPDPAREWAAILYAGPGAVLGGRSAAHRMRLVRERPAEIEVVTPPYRRVVSREDVRVRRWTAVRPPHGAPPTSSVEDTILQIARSADVDELVALVGAALQLRRTTVRRLEDAVTARPHGTATLRAVLADAGEGAWSPLERVYLGSVERAHGLPRGRRQDRAHRRRAIRDVLYRDFGVIVELDGRLGHDGEGRFRDMRRDNASTVVGEATLRYGRADVDHAPCAVARQVAEVLVRHGWSADTWRSCGECGSSLRS